MAFDGIVTKSIISELQNVVGYKVDKVYEPDKNTVVLGLYNYKSNLNLLFCTLSQNARIHLSKNLQKNPVTAPNFCMLLRKHLIGLKIKKIYMIDLERIVFIELENNDNPNKPIRKKLIIELMGKHSNIILLNEFDVIIDSLRHTTVETGSSRDIYPTARYIFPTSNKFSFLDLKDFDDFYSKIEPDLTEFITSSINNIDNLDVTNFKLDKTISNKFNGISAFFVKNIIRELGISTISKDALEKIYNKIKDIIQSSSQKLIFIEQDNKPSKDYYITDDYNIVNDTDDYNIVNFTKEVDKIFSNNYLLDKFYYEKESNELFKNYRNSILTLILSTLKKYEKRLENIDNKLLECKDMDKYKLYGELITANLYRIPNKNTSQIQVENYYDNNKIITINLDNRYYPSINAKHFFKKYNKLKNALEIVTLQKKETIQDINYIESVVYELNTATSIDDIDSIYEEISENSIFENKIKSKKNTKKNKKAKLMTTNKNVSFNPLKYTIDGFTILVGRNNKENDYLTFKIANKNDIWFHTKDIHGSHVILKVNQEKQIPDEILLEAARLASKHSKAKNSSHVPVDYCKVSFVKKPSGSKPGFVIYSNNKTLYV